MDVLSKNVAHTLRKFTTLQLQNIGAANIFKIQFNFTVHIYTKSLVSLVPTDEFKFILNCD